MPRFIDLWVDHPAPPPLGAGLNSAGPYYATVPSSDDLSSFISASFPSVWTLELLLLLKSDKRPWSRGELIESLRASELVVSQSLDSLIAGGLASTSEGGAEYTPVSDTVDRLVADAERLYASKPNQVRRMIVTSSAGGITAFADAFKLRKD
ncbi:hypothetical protein H8M03_07515 [Sphingomonas sabuli]|uniref:Uncharacterized protein n=1 Tax=Sphingomonas sabuli TaxID=2764186 RepID=A0A7G9KZU6_9SPHN|nr:hypothetical protein [Sphingomonas sabuli]QNM81895.1 hypothetical protein H8M03_07515 [Sphingomonas sabuli]